MAKFLNKDPITYERERDNFLKDLHHFHETRGTSFKKLPKISGNDIDLYLLYVLVTAHGGWIKVNTRNEWSSLCEQFHLPTSCVNSGVGLKQIYLRYLDRYEKVHFLGEDGHQADDDDEDSRHRKWSARSLHSVPLTYNHHQHNVIESLRDYNGLSSNLYKPSNYDKLALSLISPLPNEQDFAINVCTLLSNEGKLVLRLDKYPRLANILLAHAGVFDSPGTRQLFIEVYSRVRNYSINSFWSDVLDTSDALDLTDERTFMKKPSSCTNTFSRRKTLERERVKREQQQRNSKSSKTSATILSTIKSAATETPGESTATTTATTTTAATEITTDKESATAAAAAAVVEETKDAIEETPMEVDSVTADCQRIDIDDIINYRGDDDNLTDQNQNSIKFEDEDKDLFCMGRTLGTQDPYGQRVIQIAIILRNLSFTPENAVILGRNRCFLRFVLLCVRARWSNLHQLGFDMLGNCANEIMLKDAGDRITNGILSCVSNGVDSSDRFIVISCLEVLNKISQQDSNEEIVTFGLSDNVYEMICRFLALSDITLLVYTLECLYALTSLGERPCTSVARVRGAIDTLVALVTVEAQSYGPKACILMRVVETVSTLSTPATSTTSNNSTVNSSTTNTNSTSSITSNSSAVTNSMTSTSTITTASTQLAATSMANGGGGGGGSSSSVGNTTISVSPSPSRPTTPATPLSKAAANKAAEAVASLQQQHAHQQIIQENEQFALGWLRATFEPTTGVKIEQEELYKKYLSYCTKIGRRGVIAPLHFPRCVRSVFGGTIGPNPLKGENTGTQYYEGIKLRATPAPITYPSQNSGAMNVTSSSSSSSTLLSTTSSSSATSTTTISSSTTTSNSTPVKVHPVQQRTVAPINPIPDSTALDNTSKIVATPASPILKAHLSAPPKPSSNTLQNQPQNTVTKVDSKSQVSVAHPHLSQALLASGSQQQQQQQQPQQQTTIQLVNKDGDNRIGATSSSIIKSLLATKVAQRQQQQRLLQQQLSGVVQPTAPTATPATQSSSVALRAPTSAKQKVITSSVPARKIQRLNGAKIIISNNCDVKTEVNDNDTNNQSVTSQNVAVSTMTENHININQQICRPPISTTPTSLINKLTCRTLSTPIAEDSDSTNNSLASSSGIGGSRDYSGIGAEEENSLTSFEGILQNGGAPSSIELDTQDDNSSKDSSSLSSKEKPLQSLMLADLLERKVDKELIMNGVLLKNSISDKGIDLMENHIKKVLKESTDVKVKVEIKEEFILPEVSSDDALIEAPRGLKRSLSDTEENGPIKKPKYSNGTTSPEASIDAAIIESTLSSIKSEEPDDDKDGEKATVSSTAANLYAALAADCIEDEIDIVDEPIKQEPTTFIKEEPRFANQTETHNHQQQQQHNQQQQHIQTQQQIQVQSQPQQLIVAAPRQIVVQQAIQANNQVIIPGQVKRTNTSQPQVLLQQSAGGQLQYVVSGGVPGQNYVLAQSQTALVQGQAQTVLVAQTTQQQGTGAKTIIILQPQATTQQGTQKVVAMTPQGQQVVVTQVPRPIIQNSALGNIPPPLVPTSSTMPQTSIIVNNSMAQTNTNTVTVTIPAVTQQSHNATSSVPSRVVTPTPASTPPPTRPTTPHQAAATTHAIVPVNAKQPPVKIIKNSSTPLSTSTENDNKPSTSNQQQLQSTENKTVTIKIDPNSFLCEWRGCLKQFKTAHEVYLHVCEAHCPTGPDEILCLWASCDGLKRRRFSLMTHLHDRHCHADGMAIRRKQLTSTGKSEVSTSTPAIPPHHPGYAPNAAFHAIKRHALEFVNPKELMQRPSKPAAAIASSSPRSGQNPPSEQDDNEGPVTKSIRLTAALILRNLVIYSAHGRRHLRAYEPHLAGVALSNVESSRTIAQVLYDMNDQSNSNHR